MEPRVGCSVPPDPPLINRLRGTFRDETVFCKTFLKNGQVDLGNEYNINVFSKMAPQAKPHTSAR